MFPPLGVFVSHAGLGVPMWKHLSWRVPNQYIGNTQGLPGVIPPSVVVQGNVRFFNPGSVKK